MIKYVICIPRRSGHGNNKNVPSLGHCSWRGTQLDVNDEGVFVDKGWINACDPREAMLDDDLGEDHVGLFILYCLDDISTIMNIWKWPLS